MITVFIWRSTATGARLTARTAERSDALSDILMSRERCISPRRLASATTSRAAVTTIRHANISEITPKRCPIMTEVSSKYFANPLSIPDRHLLNPLISPKGLSELLCRTMIRTRCISISAACSERRRQRDCSISTVSAHRQSGAARRSSGRRTRREKSARGRLCCTIRRQGGGSRNRRLVSAGRTRNYGCRTSICGSVCSASTCSLYIPTRRSFWLRVRNPPLSLRTICRMSFGSLRAEERMLQYTDYRFTARTRCYSYVRPRCDRCLEG